MNQSIYDTKTELRVPTPQAYNLLAICHDYIDIIIFRFIHIHTRKFYLIARMLSGFGHITV